MLVVSRYLFEGIEGTVRALNSLSSHTQYKLSGECLFIALALIGDPGRERSCTNLSRTNLQLS